VTVVGATRDPDGRRVVLTQERWEHIIEPDGHPELSPYQNEIVEAVRAPDRRLEGWEPNEEWFYLGHVGPSRWLKAVVIYEGVEGRIITAFPRRAFP
jgi:hypothetical protein